MANKRKNDDLMDLQEVINIFSIFVLTVIFQFLRRSHRVLFNICSPPYQVQDFSVFVSGFSNKINPSQIKLEISQFFNKNSKSKLIPVQISPVFTY
jgi:hypothetical protein